MMLLAGDIGGTKTILALFAPDNGPRQPVMEATFPSGHYASLSTMVHEFLRDTPIRPQRASFGVAGPITLGRATLTNLPWLLDERELAAELDLESVALLNDLQAVAQAVPWLTADDVQTLQTGEGDPHGAIAVIAPGTGLGEAFLTWDGAHHRAYPSEGGHADFAPTNALEMELLRFMLDRYDHVSYERVCSGRAIPDLYAFRHAQQVAAPSRQISEQLAAAVDPTPVIMHAAAERTCDLCVATLDLFIAILGAQAGNLALGMLATGGVYLGGGIPPRILPQLADERFLIAFRSKGRVEPLLSRIPVHVIVNPKAALIGAACHGLTFQQAERSTGVGGRAVCI
jgi:glucokinase